MQLLLLVMLLTYALVLQALATGSCMANVTLCVPSLICAKVCIILHDHDGSQAGACTCHSLYEQALLAVGMLHGGSLGSLIAGKIQRCERDVHHQLQPARS